MLLKYEFAEQWIVRKSLVILSFDVVDKMHSFIVSLNRINECKKCVRWNVQNGKSFSCENHWNDFVRRYSMRTVMQSKWKKKRASERATEWATQRVNVRIKKTRPVSDYMNALWLWIDELNVNGAVSYATSTTVNVKKKK